MGRIGRPSMFIKKENLTIRLPCALARQVRLYAPSNQSKYIEEAIVFYIANEKLRADVEAVSKNVTVQCVICGCKFSQIKFNQCPSCSNKTAYITFQKDNKLF